jgi:CRISPR-associated protein Cas2
MGMTVIVTRDVADRFRGFLASTMLEISPGVYTSPNMSKAVRERVWRVMEDWHSAFGGGAIVITWRDPTAPGGQGLLSLGQPPRAFEACDGMVLIRRPL